MRDHLTIANPTLQAFIDMTPAGMMHWSGTGPAGKSCFGCEHFNQRRLRTKAQREAPEAVRGACGKYHRVMTARAAHPVRRKIYMPTTPACSHFSEGT
jgi:hypothetical protein